MQHRLLLSVLFFAFSSIKAQKISVKEGSASFSIGRHDALTTSVYETSKEDVQSKWKNFLKDFKNEKVKMDNGEVFGDNIVINEWGNNPVDVYAVFEEDKKNQAVIMSVAFDLGGAYLSSNDEKQKQAIKMIRDFSIKTSKEGLESKIKIQEKALSKLVDHQKELENDNKNSKSDIENFKLKIKKAEDELILNEAEQLKKKAEIENQKKLVEEVKVLMNKVG